MSLVGLKKVDHPLDRRQEALAQKAILIRKKNQRDDTSHLVKKELALKGSIEYQGQVHNFECNLMPRKVGQCWNITEKLHRLRSLMGRAK